MKNVDFIKHAFEKALKEMNIDSSDITYSVKKTELIHGDYTSEVAMLLAKKMKRNPVQIAEEIVERLMLHLGDRASSVKAVKPGFINIRLSDPMLLENLSEILISNF